ncbi:MAG: CARDB domain-containing protein, partial [Actinomycetota bacterium]
MSAVTAPSRIICDPADITVSWTVSNLGDGAGRVDTWVDRIILSRNDTVGDGDDLVIAEYTHFGLMPSGTAYTRTEAIQLPLGVDNRFTLFVVTDANNEVYEHTDTGANHASPVHPVDIMRRPFADLVVEQVVAPTTGSNGESLNLGWTVANRGIGQTSMPEWFDEVYYSTSPDGTGLVLLQRFSRVGHLGVDATYVRNVSLILPHDLTEDFYIYVKSSGPYEFIYNDEGNTMRSDLITLDYIPPPDVDLTVTGITVTPTAFDNIARDGQTVDLTWTVRNQGTDTAAGSWVDSFFLAPDGDRSKSIKIGDWTLSQGLEAGKTYTRIINLRLPLHISGVYEVYVRTDARNELLESDETNNAPALATDLTVALTPRADLAVTSVEAPESVTSGTVIDVNWVVSNLSLTATPTGGSRWVDGIYLSLNNKLDGGDKLLGWIQNGSALAGGQQYASSATFTLPQGVAGQMYIIVKADASRSVDEFSNNPDYENNNTYVRPIYIDAQPVPPPDLVVSGVYGPTEAFDGTEITVIYRVTNKGAGITYPANWTDALWLTVDKTAPNPGKGDIRIGTAYHSGALEVGEYYEGTITGKIPKHMQGIYELMVYSDAWNNVFELTFDVNINPDDPNQLNNNNYKTAGEPLTILYTQPADLEVTHVTTPETARGGSQITVGWTVANNGANVTDLDRWADAIYVSPTPELGPGSIMVFGLLHEGALQRGQSYTHEATFTLPPGAEGFYIIVETNVDPYRILTANDQLLAEMAAITDRLKTAIGDYENMSPGEIQSKLEKFSLSELRNILWAGVPVQKVWEGPYTGNNQRSALSTITPLIPDLEVTEIVLPESAYSGEAVEITWTVTNVGDDPVWSGTQRWRDYLYVSPDPVFIFSRATSVGSVVRSNADG